MSNFRQVLQGVQVLDFTQIGAGPTCTLLLADLGANVVKVEPLEGELGRTLGPAWIGDEAALFHGLNRNKKSIALNLKSPEGVAVAKRLIGQSQIVVESMRPGVMERLGLGADKMKADNTNLIWCSLSAYGQVGPYSSRAGVDGILQADSGLMSLIGFANTGPAKVQTPVVDIFTGYVAAFGILAALLANQSSPVPPLDVNLFHSAIALQQASLSSYLADRQLPEKQGSAAPYSAPNEAFETADGWIMVAAYNAGRWERLCHCLEAQYLAENDQFKTSALRVKNRGAMIDQIAPIFRKRTTDAWLSILEAADILCAPVNSYDRLVQHPQLLANNILTTVQDKWRGSVQMPDFPIRAMGVLGRAASPAPRTGEQSREVLSDAGFSSADIRRLVEAGVVRMSDAFAGVSEGMKS